MPGRCPNVGDDTVGLRSVHVIPSELRVSISFWLCAASVSSA
jgi:hypothetical protein